MSILTDNLCSAVNNDQELKGTSFALQLTNHLLKNGSIDEQTIVGFALNKTKKEITIPEVTAAPHRDLRFNLVLMRGIRKFPSLKAALINGKELEVHYRVDFGNETGSKASVFVGSNGIGKSSVYTALEWIALQKSYSAEFRGYKQDDVDGYIRHINTKNADSSICLSTASSVFEDKLDQKRAGILYPAYFCMEYDIEQLSKKDTEEFFAKQLGLEDYYSLLKNFDKLIQANLDTNDEYNKVYTAFNETSFIESLLNLTGSQESESLKRIQSCLDTLNKKKEKLDRLDKESVRKTKTSIRNLAKLIYSATPDISLYEEFYQNDPRAIDVYNRDFDSLEELETGYLIDRLHYFIDHIYESLHFYIENVGEEFMTSEMWHKAHLSNLHNLQFQLQKIKDRNPIAEISPELYDDFYRTFIFLQKRYNGIIKKFATNAQEIFNSIMQPYLDPDIKEFKISGDDVHKSINVSLVAKHISNGIEQTLEGVEPRKFLNTFRFKVFCVGIKISLALTCSQLYNINAPIVIDDVFDSSDFANRESIKKFIEHVYDSYEILFKKPTDLQLIFFTQDDVISDSVYRGLKDKLGNENIVYKRIYNHYDVVFDTDVAEYELPTSDGKKNIYTINISQDLR